MRKWICALALVFLAVGCQKLNYEKTIDVPMGILHSIEFDPPSYSQKVTATLSPESCSVSVAHTCGSSSSAAT